MELGTLSLSLNVKDIHASLDFYTILGFIVIDGGHINRSYPDSESSRWRILENDGTRIGLFEGTLNENVITFNPPDVRKIQSLLQENSITIFEEAAGETGPTSMMLKDPDGNTILFDQNK